MSTALIEAARSALNAWEYDSSECRWHMDNLRTALAAAEAQPVGEPVAWAWKHKGTAARGMYFEDQIKYFDTLESADSYEWTPLYAAPQPAARPLTDEQIRALVLATVYEGDSSTAHRDAWAAEIGIPFARAIEAAHAIGSQP